MKYIAPLTAALLAVGLLSATPSHAQSQDVGRVLSSTPVMQQVSVPRQVCTQELVEVQRPNSGAGAAIGAIAGGALGSASGHGPGRAAATVIGAIGGAILGDRIEGSPAPQAQSVQRCSTQYFVENRVNGYNVVYEFGGKQYSVQLPQDPGPTIALRISPVASTLASTETPPVMLPPPMPSSTVITSSTVTYPVVVAAPRFVPQIVFPGPFPYVGHTAYPRFEHHGHYERGYDRGRHRNDDRHWN